MTHEFDGKKYEKASTHQKEWGTKLISELKLKGNERVLDLGCGDGTLSVQISELLPNGKIVGIDASNGMIDAAYPKTKKNLRFQLMDINDLNFVEEFDIVFSNATLHWVLDHRKLLSNVYHALRNNGKVRFNFAADGNCSHFFKVIRKAMAQDHFAEYFSEFQWPWYMPTVEEYSILAKQREFSSVNVWGENVDRCFPDVETMVKWIDQPSLVPLLPYVPSEKQAAFREFVVERMVTETKKEDSRCFETFRRINLLARK